MKLYEISNEYEKVLMEVMGGEDGELTEDMIANLDALQDDFEKKAICVASYIKNLQAEEDMISLAMKDMATRKSRLAKQADSLAEYLQFNLQKLSITEIKSSPYFKIRLKVCPQSVDIFDETVIPAEFWREKITTSVDKIKLKEVLSEGVEVPGAAIQRKIKLEIK